MWVGDGAWPKRVRPVVARGSASLLRADDATDENQGKRRAECEKNVELPNVECRFLTLTARGRNASTASSGANRFFVLWVRGRDVTTRSRRRRRTTTTTTMALATRDGDALDGDDGEDDARDGGDGARGRAARGRPARAR